MTVYGPRSRTRSVSQLLDSLDDPQKTAQAQKRHPRVKRWVSARGTASTRRYVCNCCDQEIDSESGKYGPTKHAIEAIKSHECQQ